MESRPQSRQELLIFFTNIVLALRARRQRPVIPIASG